MTQIQYRTASEAECSLLARLNQQLIQDEGHWNPMNLTQLEDRMRGWLAGEYQAVIFEIADEAVAYALYKIDGDGIYLRQFFVDRSRRRQGLGSRAIGMLKNDIWPRDRRIVVEVLSNNHRARGFWQATGFKEYALAMEILPGTD